MPVVSLVRLADSQEERSAGSITVHPLSSPGAHVAFGGIAGVREGREDSSAMTRRTYRGPEGS